MVRTSSAAFCGVTIGMLIFFNMSVFNSVSWKDTILITSLYLITTTYVLFQQIELYELIFMYLFGMLVFLAFTCLRLLKDSLVIGIIVILAGGGFTMILLFIATVSVVAIYKQPADIQFAYIETLQTLFIPICILGLGKINILLSPVISREAQVGRYNKLLLLLLSPYVLGFYISGVLMLAILIRDINYFFAAIFFMALAALSEIVASALIKNTGGNRVRTQ